MFRQQQIARWLLILIAVMPFFTPSTAIAQRQSATLTRLIRAAKPAVVTVGVFNQQGQMLSYGSGFFVASHRVVTNYHVIANAYAVEVRTINGAIYSVDRILAVDRSGDLALLHVKVPAQARIAPLTITRAAPQEGEQVFVIGSPLGLEGTTSEGIVSAVRYVEGFGNVIQITAPISAGSSGGPVLNMRGQVIGVATLMARDGQNLNLAMTGERVLALDGRAKAANSYARGVRLFEARDYVGAVAAFQEAIRLDVESADAWASLGDCMRALGRYEDAIKAYNHVIRLDPKDVAAYLNAGVAYQALELHGTALDYYRHAIQLAPQYGLAHYNAGVAHFNLGDYSSAIQAFQAALNINPHDALTHYSLGMTCLRLRDKKAAKKQHKILLNMDRQLALELQSAINQ